MAELISPKPDERIPYIRLTGDQQQQLHDWLTDHHVDYTRVPVHDRFDFDAATREWRIPVFWVDAEGHKRLTEDGRDVRRHVIRRRELRPLPWPTYGPPRVWINGVEIPGVLDVQFGDLTDA